MLLFLVCEMVVNAMEPDDVSRDVDQLLNMNVLTQMALERKRARRGPEDPTRLQAFLLTLIADADGASVGDLVDHLEIAPATMSQMVSHLEERGWVERRLDPADRRRHRVHLTPAGRQAMDEVRQRRRQRLTVILSRLTAEERGQLMTLAERLAVIIRDAADDAAFKSPSETVGDGSDKEAATDE
jgi:DNA-binding MarR family transcriptional regulator